MLRAPRARVGYYATRPRTAVITPASRDAPLARGVAPTMRATPAVLAGGLPDVSVEDLLTDARTPVGAGADGPGDRISYGLSLSVDGAVLAFTGRACDPVAADIADASDVFVTARVAGCF